MCRTLSFFFQAEDGIRDGRVTGVQTCALPVVAKTETFNESAEALAVPDLNPEELLKSGKVKPLPADAEERFRGSFLKEETPPFTDYRVKVIETPEATPRSPSE